MTEGAERIDTRTILPGLKSFPCTKSSKRIDTLFGFFRDGQRAEFPDFSGYAFRRQLTAKRRGRKRGALRGPKHDLSARDHSLLGGGPVCRPQVCGPHNRVELILFGCRLRVVRSRRSCLQTDGRSLQTAHRPSPFRLRILAAQPAISEDRHVCAGVGAPVCERDKKRSPALGGASGRYR